MQRRFLSLLTPALLAATLLAAQAPEVEITAESHHHLTFENKYIRVFNVEVPPHSETLMHWHRHDYIYVTLGPTEVVNAVKDKPPITVKLQDGGTRFSPASFAHIARNSSDQAFRNVTIEILDDANLRNSAPKWDEDRALETFPGGTQQILFVKDGIRVSEFELQPGATAPTPATAYLLVAVSDLRLDAANRPKNAPHSAWDQLDEKSGASIWIPPSVLHSVTNTAAKPAKFITLEFPQ